MKEIIRKILLCICIVVFVYSSCQLGIIFYDYYTIEKDTKEIVQDYTNIQEEDTPLTRKINFADLKNVNNDIIGWISIPDTNIDEPLLKGKNNDSYIRTDPYKKTSKAGSLFIDEANTIDFQDDNTIIYGHNMKNGSRFHDLRYYKEEDYYQKHSSIYIYLPDGKVQVYKVYAFSTIDATSELYCKKINYQSYIKNVLRQSTIDSEISEKQVPLIMLSTCRDAVGSARYVVFAYLDKVVE